MTVRFYIIPYERGTTYRQLKYFTSRFGSGTITALRADMDYGLQDIALVVADVSTAEHSILAAASDVLTIPVNIDAQIGVGALSAVQAALESLWIPGNWVKATNTYRTVLRVVAGLFQFAQRHHGLHNEALMQGAVNWSLTLGDLSQARRNRIQATANSFGYDTSSLTLSSTLRDVLKFLGQKWGIAPFNFSLGGTTVIL